MKRGLTALQELALSKKPVRQVLDSNNGNVRQEYRPIVSNNTPVRQFDKKVYQREYMRKHRKKDAKDVSALTWKRNGNWLEVAVPLLGATKATEVKQFAQDLMNFVQGWHS